jgi:hypothetical protein
MAPKIDGMSTGGSESDGMSTGGSESDGMSTGGSESDSMSTGGSKSDSMSTGGSGSRKNKPYPSAYSYGSPKVITHNNLRACRGECLGTKLV